MKKVCVCGGGAGSGELLIDCTQWSIDILERWRDKNTDIINRIQKASWRISMILYWLLLLSTNNCKSRLWHFIWQTKAFGANAPSSAAFHLQLELFKITKSPKLKKWKWLPHYLKPLSLLETREASHKKFNWILQFSSPHLTPPLLLPCPKFLLTEA